VRGRFVVIAVLLPVLGGWLGIWQIAADPGSEIGGYWFELFLAHVAVSYLALLACYVVLGRRLWKRRLGRALLNVGAIVLAVLIVELPAALGWLDYRVLLVPKMTGGPGPHNRRLDAQLIAVRPAHDHYIERQPGDDVFGLAIPITRIYETEYRFDKNGFRNPSDLDRAKVVLLGDSFAEGYKTPQEEICATQLGRLLGLEVANLAQCDFGPRQELVTLQRFGVKLSPDMVVWFFYEGNDLHDIGEYDRVMRDWEGFVQEDNGFRNRCFSLNALEILAFRLDQLRSRESDLARRRSGVLPHPTATQQKTIYFGTPPYALSQNELGLLAKLHEILLAADRLCEQHGIRFVVANVPVKLRVYRDLCRFPEDSEVTQWVLNDVPQRLQRWCQEVDVPYIDLTPALQAAAGSGKPVYLPDDMHWSAQGHGVVAEEIAKFVRSVF